MGDEHLGVAVVMGVGVAHEAWVSHGSATVELGSCRAAAGVGAAFLAGDDLTAAGVADDYAEASLSHVSSPGVTIFNAHWGV